MKLVEAVFVNLLFTATALGTTGQSDSVIVVRFGGDCLLAENYTQALGDSPGFAFLGFDLLEAADVAMVNLEGPVTARGVRGIKPFTFRMSPRIPLVLKQAGIDVVNIANNHIFDYGADGLFDTIQFLDSAGVSHVGGGNTIEEAHRPFLFERWGITIAFLGYYGGSEAPAASSSRSGVAERRLDLIAKDIRRARHDHEATYVILNFHWGIEKAEYPDDDQIAFARAAIDSGADAVVGHHPHVLQGIERYNNGVIAYSLGNLIFGGKNRPTYDTAILELRLRAKGVECAVLPVRVQDWRLQPLSGSAADSLFTTMKTRSEIFPASIFHK